MSSLGSTPGIVAGVAIGGAASAAFQPLVEPARQEAWRNHPNKLIDVNLVARLVAQGGVALGDRTPGNYTGAYDEAARDGYSPDKLDALVYLAQTVPGVAEALTMWRRLNLPDALWTHALEKQGYDARYLPYFNALKTAELVGIGDIGYAIVRGLLPAPSWVPVPVPSSGGTVPRFPVVPIDPVQLAADLGFSEPMLKIITGRSGLSLAPVMAANALFRGLINDVDFLVAIGEGDLRTEWAQTVRDVSRQILTADQYLESALRGWKDLPTAKSLAAQHGMSDPDAQLLYEIRRRPLTVANITKALARGGTFNPEPGEITDPYSASVHQADLGPEWYDLGEALKYSYPSAFVLRAMAQAGEITAEQTNAILLSLGWIPWLAAKVTESWTGGTLTDPANPPTTAAETVGRWTGAAAQAADPNVKKAQTQLWSKTHTSYINAEAVDADAIERLNLLGIPAAAQEAILSLWKSERALIRKQLTPKQIVKALSGGVTNPAAGAAWTQQEALDALMARGYDQADAEVLIAEG